MKIAFLTPEFPLSKFTSSGGIGTSIMNLAKGLTNAGNEVSILICGQKTGEFFEENGIAFYKIKNIKFKGFSTLFTQKKIQKLINKLVTEKKIELL